MSRRVLLTVMAAALIAATFVMSCGGKSSSPTSPTGGGGGAELNSGTIAGGATFAHTFATAGTFNYHCTMPGHGVMTGTVTVNSGGSPGSFDVQINATAAFSPVTCNVGSTVTWHNNTGIGHTVTSN